MTLLLCLTVALIPSIDVLTTTPERVTGESWRDVAAAQAGQGAFQSMELPWSSEATLGRRLQLAGKDVALYLLARTVEGSVSIEKDANAPRVLWVDADDDGVRGDLEVFPLTDDVTGEVKRATSIARLGIPVELRIYEYAGEQRLSVATEYHFESEVEIEGDRVRLLFLDRDLDGRPSRGDLWAALSSRQAAFVTDPTVFFCSVNCDEPWYFGERVLVPSEFDDVGGVQLSLKPQTIPRHRFLAKRAARVQAEFDEGFDQTRADFLRAYEIDPDRAIDPTPPAWHHAQDLSEALAFARVQKKPLYVEFGSDGCGWCKRYGWLNYKDAEVTEQLRHLCLVKINRDIDPDQTAPGLGLKGVPCHALFDAEGHALHTSQGWMAPKPYVEELRSVRKTLLQSAD